MQPSKNRHVCRINHPTKGRFNFKKIRNVKGTFYAKILTIKDRNSMDLTEAELRKGGKNSQNYTKKILTTPR